MLISPFYGLLWLIVKIEVIFWRMEINNGKIMNMLFQRHVHQCDKGRNFY